MAWAIKNYKTRNLQDIDLNNRKRYFLHFYPLKNLHAGYHTIHDWQDF